MRCGNAGWSGWIDEFGVVRATLTNETGTIYYRGSKVIELQRDARWIERNSFFVEHGNWFVLVSAALAGAAVLLLRSSVRPGSGAAVAAVSEPRP
jgi:apolipoprotein N-acyltransferase